MLDTDGVIVRLAAATQDDMTVMVSACREDGRVDGLWCNAVVDVFKRGFQGCVLEAIGFGNSLARLCLVAEQPAIDARA